MDHEVKPRVLIVPSELGSIDVIGPMVLVRPAVENNVAAKHLRPPTSSYRRDAAAGALVDGRVMSAAFLRMIITGQ